MYEKSNSEKFWNAIFITFVIIAIIGCVIIVWWILLIGASIMYLLYPFILLLEAKIDLTNIKEYWWMWLNPVYWGIIAILLFNKWLDGLKF